MNIDDLSSAEKCALPKVLAYWSTHSDWECPTLFGLDLESLQSIIADWPLSLNEQESKAALAIVGALRELLYGASAVSQENFLGIAGISHQEAHNLFQRLMPRIDCALKAS